MRRPAGRPLRRYTILFFLRPKVHVTRINLLAVQRLLFSTWCISLVSISVHYLPRQVCKDRCEFKHAKHYFLCRSFRSSPTFLQLSWNVTCCWMRWGDVVRISLDNFGLQLGVKHTGVDMTSLNLIQNRLKSKKIRQKWAEIENKTIQDFFHVKERDWVT